MIATATSPETLVITEEIHVNASRADTFDSILTQLGEENTDDNGKSLSMKIEAHPGGRWWRDLGDGNGHLWAFVQSIKRGVLLEFCGPLFMSTGATSNLTYRLSDKDGGTLISFRHTVVGPVPDGQRDNMREGWGMMNANIKRAAEAV
jgi:uncharacterized protein YndB with AHSA1/START domain